MKAANHLPKGRQSDSLSASLSACLAGSYTLTNPLANMVVYWCAKAIQLRKEGD